MSSLVGLEELKMVASFTKWQAEGKERKNAGLRELECLSNLTCLEIEIEDPNLAIEQICLPSKIVKFDVTIGTGEHYFFTPDRRFEKKMKLCLPGEITPGNWIQERLRSVEYLDLEGDGSSNLDFGQAHRNLRSLTLTKCSTVKKLVNKTSLIDERCGTTAAIFPLLEHLELYDLPNLEDIFEIDGSITDEESGSNSFKNLKELSLVFLPALKHWWRSPYQKVIPLGNNLSSIRIYSCKSLTNLFSLSLSMPNDCLPQLERLEISFCDMMEQVFLWNEEENGSGIGQQSHHIKIIFPKLKSLQLQYLPNLSSFCEGIESIEFPILNHMSIQKCPKLKSLVSITSSTRNSQSNWGGGHDHDGDDDILQLLCNPDKEEESFKNSVAQVKGVDLFELNRETHSLMIKMEDYTFAADQVIPPSDEWKFDITIGNPPDRSSLRHLSGSKIMNLYLSREITLGNWIHQCVRNVEYMRLEGEGSSSLDLGQAENMRGLALGGCSKVTKLMLNATTSSSVDGRHGTNYSVLPASLESLKLYNLINLEEICDFDGPIPEEGYGSKRIRYINELTLRDLPALKYLWKNPYQSVISLQLSSISIHRCGSLPNLFSFSLSMENDCLQSLHRLEIVDCKMMKQIFLWNEEENGKGIEQQSADIEITLPKLQWLKLFDLPNLTTFCEGIESIEFHRLIVLEIGDCPKLKSLVSVTSSTGNISHNNSEGVGINHDYNDDDDSSRLFWNPDKVSFHSLWKLEICGYNKIPIGFFSILERLDIVGGRGMSSLFSSSTAQNFHNLEELSIKDCEEMVKVIEDNKDEDACQTTICLFSKLQVLRLSSLPKLEIFCKWTCALELPSLETVHISRCPKMERFSLGSLATPNLKELNIDGKEITNSTELNGLRRRFFRVEEEESFYKWEAKVKGVDLSELRPSFIDRETGCLKIEIRDSTLAAEQVSLPSNISYYDITIGDPRDGFSPELSGNKMNLHLPRDITLGSWIHQCVRNVEYLRLEGEGSINLDLGQAQKMTSLALGGCSKVTKVYGRYGTNYTVLPASLESLELFNLINLEEICDFDDPIPEEGSVSEAKSGSESGCGYNCISNIEHLKLRDLPALKHLWKSPYQLELDSICIHRCGSLSNLFSFSLSMGNDCLRWLRELEIVDCKMVEHVFLWNEEECGKGIARQSRHIKITLKSLKLLHLPNLTTFCKGIESIDFSELTKLEIGYCPKLKNLVSISSSTGNINQKIVEEEGIGHDRNDNVDSSRLFWNPNKVSFGSLKELQISGNNKIPIDFFNGLERLAIVGKGGMRSLFSSSVAQNFVNLKELSIEDCGEMVKVIEDNENQDACESTCPLELPSLERVNISQCLKMESFSSRSLATPNLKTIYIDGKEIINSVKDLNVALQQHFCRVKEEEEKNEREEEKEEREEKEREDDVEEDIEEGQKRKGEIEDEES